MVDAGLVFGDCGFSDFSCRGWFSGEVKRIVVFESILRG